MILERIENKTVYFSISNFIEDQISIRIFDIRVVGVCKSMGPSQIFEDVKKIPLATLEVNDSLLNRSIKSDTIDYVIPRGQTVSFWFKYENPAFKCNVRLFVQYTDPISGERAVFEQRIDI